MKKFLASAGAIAMLAISSQAAAVTPATPATATAKVFKPLTIATTQNLDFGIVVLSGSSFSNQSVVMDTTGAITSCGSGGNLTCSGSSQAAGFHLAGTANAFVTVQSPGFNLANGSATLPFVPSSTSQVVQLDSGGALDFSLGGTVSGLSNTTTDGVYTGTFAVTADYQ